MGNKLSKFIQIFSLIAILLPTSSFAAFTAGITYHGRILKPDNTPESDSSVQFKLQIYTPGSENCLMYEERQTKDLSTSSGVFAITINDGSGTRLDSSGYQLDQIFANRSGASLTFPGGTCSIGSTWNPNIADGRKLIVSFKDSSMGAWEPLPAQTINYVPTAIEAFQVGGFPATSMLRVENASGPQNIASLTPAQGAALIALSNGSSTAYVQAGVNGATLPSFASDPGAPAAGQVWYDSTNKVVKYYDGTSIQTVGSGAVSGNQITSGTIGGTTSINTTGTVTAASVSSTTDSTNALRIFENTNTHKATVTVPASLASDYSLQLPGALPTTTNQFLVSSTAGVTSWSSNMVIDGTGNVGIGSTAPTQTLDVNGVAAVGSLISGTGTGATAPGITFAGSPQTGFFSGAANTLSIAVSGSQKFFMNNAAYVFWASGDFHSGNGTAYTPTSAASPFPASVWANASNDTPADGAGSFIRTAVKNTATTPQNFYFGAFANTAGFTPTVVLGQQTGATAYTERLRIDASGNVGIGTSNPGSLLDVNGNLQAEGAIASYNSNTTVYTSTSAGASVPPVAANGIFNTNSTVGTAATLRLVPRNGNGYNYSYIGAVSQAAGYTPVMVFGQQTGATSYSEAMRIDASGNVGIGTTTVPGNFAVDNTGHNATICLNGGCVTSLAAGFASQTSNSNFVLNSDADGAGSDGGFDFKSNNSSIFKVSNSGAITTYGNITGNSALAVSAGGTNQNLALNSSGTGAVNVGTGNGTGLSVVDPGVGTVNYVTVKGADAGNGPTIGTAGSDANINLVLSPKGTGNVGIGTSNPASLLSVGATSQFRVNSSGFISAPILTTNSNIDAQTQGAVAYTPTSVASLTPTGNSITMENNGAVDGAYNGIQFGPRNTATSFQHAYIGAISSAAGSTPAIVIGQQTGATAYNERMRIDTAGNVGIGTTTPASPLFVTSATDQVQTIIKGNATQTNHIFDVQNSAGTPVFYVSGFGNVITTGIMQANSFTASNGANSSTGASLTNIGTGLTPISSVTTLANGSTYDTVGANHFSLTNKMANGNIAALAITPTYNQTGSTAANTDLLVNRTETAIGSGNQYLAEFQVAGSDKFVITNTGNVGIGTTTPASALDVRAPAATQGLSVTGASNAWAGNIYSGTTAGQAFGLYVQAGSNSSDFALSVKDKTSSTYYFNVRGDGNVGVGTATPVSKLTVNGVIESQSGGIKFPDGTTQTTAATGGSGGQLIQAFNSVAGPMPKTSSSFTTTGKTLHIVASGSGYNASGAAGIGMAVQIDGVTYGYARTYTNEVASHKAFPAATIVVTGLAAGSHTLTLTSWNGTSTDANDYFSATVEEMPY